MDGSGKSKAIVFGDTFTGDQNYEIINEQISNYLSYWNDIESVVLVAKTNEDAKLMSALFAAYMAAPLIIIDDTNFDNNFDNIKTKKVYDIAGSIDSLNSTNQAKIKNNCDIKAYLLNDLYNPIINGFVGIKSEILFTQ